jgi:hypothetical protein
MTDTMRTWDPDVSNCNDNGLPTSGSNCPARHPIPFSPQAHIKLADGTLVRRVNGEDLRYDHYIKFTAYIQKLAPGSGTWDEPQYLLDPDTCDCTYQISRIRHLRDGRLIALGQKWDTYDPKSGIPKPLLLLGDATATTWTEALTIPSPAPFGADEWDAAELPNGDLLAVFRTSNNLRKQGLLEIDAGGDSWTLTSANVEVPPFVHAGHPELLATSSGAVLYVNVTDNNGQRGIWYLSNSNAEANSTGWTQLPFASNGGAEGNCTSGSAPFLCSTRHYPRAIEDCDGSVCTIYVFSHFGDDDDYGEVNQYIVLQKFRLTSP